MLGFCLVQLLSWSCVGGFLRVVYGVVFELISVVGCRLFGCVGFSGYIN